MTKKTSSTTSKEKATPFIKIDNSKPDLRKKEEPLISLRVTNPITYLKSWWKRVMSKEGVDFRFRIKPLTAIGMTIIITTFGFGVGKFSFVSQKPFIQYTPTIAPTPIPTPNLWRETAFSGTLRFSSMDGKYYLLTNSSEAINIDVLENVNLEELIGRRIFATGDYNSGTHTLIVSDAADMELLPIKIETVPIAPEPVVTPTPMATVAPDPTEELEESDNQSSDDVEDSSTPSA